MFPQERKLVFIEFCLYAVLITRLNCPPQSSELTIFNYTLYNADSLAKGISCDLIMNCVDF
jgi:hypothetical protein